ncbi:MAG: protein translocase subunit SecD [Verrucomicrobia bacterium]|nr:protein translocase subunit SecD [Verrucomicrobiota bacterium]
MTQNHFWKLLLVLFVLGWAGSELYPPKGKNLISHFEERARNKDAAFTNILTRAKELDKSNAVRTYGNLFDAVGTNNIIGYFPMFKSDGQRNPSSYILGRLQREAAGRIRLGLDLQGGTSFLMGMDTSKIDTNQVREQVMDQAVEVLRRRVDRFGVAEPLIQPAGNDRILVQLPGLSEEDRDSARRQLSRAAFLEFRMLHDQSAEFVAQGMSAPGYERLAMTSRADDGSKTTTYHLVRRQPEEGLTGKFITRAGVFRNPATGAPGIHFEFNAEGAEKFGRLTRKYSPKDNQYHLLGIVLDGVLVTAPRINEPIEGGRGEITGDYDFQEALEVANTLENPLETPVSILEERAVDPSLGADTIASGVRSAIWGTIAVGIFMLVYYLAAGVVANVAMLANILVLLGVMCSFGTVLTLPGIAGIVLTIGMAVDANVLIYERIREEIAKGKSLRGGIAAGYDRAFGTIFDSNLTTLIASVILMKLGTGPVKGFGVALTIGVLVSMFTALVITRLIFDFLVAKNLIKSLPMLHIIRGTNVDFMRYAKVAFTLSWAVILIGAGFGKKQMGIDFAGGDSLVLRFDPAARVPVEQLTKTLEEKGFKDPRFQYQQDMVAATASETLRLTTAVDVGEKAELALKEAFPAAKFERAGLDKVGATIGGEILQKALLALLASLFLILVYVAFRYEVSFAVGAVVAIVHDILMTFGIYCLAGRELNATFVAAILTIIGFSINDTIVIFDRIREILKLGARGSFTELINRALNETLSRTIITSGTVFIATSSLYLFGGGAINDFAFTFLVGIITGTYSSIYIASALVLWWHKGQRPQMAVAPVTNLEGADMAAAAPGKA